MPVVCKRMTQGTHHEVIGQCGIRLPRVTAIEPLKRYRARDGQDVVFILQQRATISGIKFPIRRVQIDAHGCRRREIESRGTHIQFVEIVRVNDRVLEQAGICIRTDESRL